MRKVTVEDTSLEEFLRENPDLSSLSLNKCRLDYKCKEGIFGQFGNLVELRLVRLIHLGDQGLCLLYRKGSMGPQDLFGTHRTIWGPQDLFGTPVPILDPRARNF